MLRSACLIAALCLGLPWTAAAQKVYHIKVHTDGGMIDSGIAAFIERAADEASINGADAIIFDIDTFGGRVDAATVIRDAILDTEMLTVAFVNKRAISAGALISLACDKIVMTTGASIGAATAVDGATGEKASDKIISYFRAEMRATAERTGRDPKIAEAMVDDEVEIPGLSDEAGRPATLTTEQALNYQIADETAENLDEVLAIYDLADAEILELGSNWAEEVLSILTHPVVTPILLAVAMFGLIAEVRTPGWGLGGTLSLLALGLFFGSSYVVRLAEWNELALFVVGVALLILEIAVIPGFGFVGLAGIICMITSLVLSQVGVIELVTFDEISGAIGNLGLAMIIAILLSLVVLRTLPKFSLFRRLVLESETRADEGYVSSPTEADNQLLGQEGISLSDMRPAGVGLFDGKRLDIVAQGEFITAHTPIKIVEARGNRIVVRPL